VWGVLRAADDPPGGAVQQTQSVQPMADQDSVHCGGGQAQPGGDPGRAEPLTAAQSQDALLKLGWGSVGAGGGDAGPIDQASLAALLVAGSRWRAAVPTRWVTSSRWPSAAGSGCTRRSRRRSRYGPQRGCGSASGRPARPSGRQIGSTARACSPPKHCALGKQIPACTSPASRPWRPRPAGTMACRARATPASPSLG
jgi:hypothetical protein